MNKQTRLIWMALALTLVLLLTTGAAAKPTRREFVGEHFLCTVGDPAYYKETGSPPVEHGRDLPWTGRAESDEALYQADSAGFQSWNLNTATGSGGVWGTFVKTVDNREGTWEGTYSGHYVDGVSYIKVRGHGTGDLAGMKYFATFYPKDPYGTPCPGGTAALAASDVIGVIVDTNH